MNWVKYLACISAVAGIGILVNGQLIHVGIILLIEAGVLFTLVDKNPKQSDSPRDTAA